MATLRQFGTVLSGNRQYNHEFTPEARAAIVAAFLAGKTVAELTNIFGASAPQTITNIIDRAQARGTTQTAPRKLGFYKTSFRDERRLFFLSAKYPEYSYAQLATSAGLNISGKTVKRVLHRYGRNKWRKAKRILLTDDDARERREFCAYWLKDPAKIKQVTETLFTDECTVQNSPFNPGQFVTRLSTQRYERWAIEPTAHSGPRISQMVWGMIWLDGEEAGQSSLIFCKGDPDAEHQGVTSKSYQEVLEEGLLPLYNAGDLFMQDNARIHTSAAIREFLETRGIWTIKWPSHSPDLNPIEHVWKELKRQIHALEPNFAGLKDNKAHQAYARALIEDAWSNMPEGFVQKLIESVPKRLRACRKAGGWYTHY